MLVVLVWTSLCSVRTDTTLGHYFPVRPSRSVSKRFFEYSVLIYIASYDLPLDAKLWSVGWPTGQLFIVFVVGFTSLVTDTSLKNFSRVVQRAITILSKLLYFLYHHKSYGVSKITLTDQRMFAFHRDFRLFEFVDRQQSLGTQFL